MADRGFIDKDMANRGARGGSSEGANTTRQSIRNNQVITGARAKATRPPAPLTRPTPPPAPQATDTSAPGNAAANIAAAIATRPSPPVVVVPPPPIVVTPPPIFIPASIPDVQSTITPLGPMLISSGDGAVNPPPGPPGGGIQSIPLGPIDIDIITEGGSGGDEVTSIPRADERPEPIESFPPPPRPIDLPLPPPEEFNPQPPPCLLYTSPSPRDS